MKNKILFAFSLIFGLMFINSGLNKFFNYLPMPSDLPEALVKVMAAFAEVKFLLPLVASAEIVGGIFFIFKKTRALGAIIVLPVNIGILFTHILFVPSGLPVAIALIVFNTFIILTNREKYLPMIEE